MTMAVRRYRLRSSFEAVQWTEDNEAELRDFTDNRFYFVDPEDRTDDPDCTGAVLDKHSSWVGVRTGQWIGRVGDDLFTYDDDVFQETYEEVPA